VRPFVIVCDHFTSSNYDLASFLYCKRKKAASLLIENSIDNILRELSEVFEMQV